MLRVLITQNASRASAVIERPHLRQWCLCAEGGKRFSKGAYFLGKIVYGKGWEELLTLLDWHQRHTKDKQTSHPTIDAYGSGEAFESVGSHVAALHQDILQREGRSPCIFMWACR